MSLELKKPSPSQSPLPQPAVFAGFVLTSSKDLCHVTGVELKIQVGVAEVGALQLVYPRDSVVVVDQIVICQVKPLWVGAFTNDSG